MCRMCCTFAGYGSHLRVLRVSKVPCRVLLGSTPRTEEAHPVASLRARHSRSCELGGKETAAPEDGQRKILGCTCRPTYSIRHHLGGNRYVSKKLDGPAKKQLAKA